MLTKKYSQFLFLKFVPKLNCLILIQQVHLLALLSSKIPINIANPP